MYRILFLAAMLGLTTSVVLAQTVPAGTVIPMMLTTTLDSAKAKPGELITGKVMDGVPLPDGKHIPKGAEVLGRVLEVSPGNGVSPAVLAVQFDNIMSHGHEIALTVRVRALASMMAVYDAQVPLFEPDTTPRNSVMLAPVGADAAFHPDNPERSPVLVQFSGELASGCGGRIAQKSSPDALWVFSPYACGVYGFGKRLVIVNDSSQSLASVVFASPKNVLIHAGSGWLLQVVSLSSR